MLSGCVIVVEEVGEICVKLLGFSATFVQTKLTVGKPAYFTTRLARLLPMFSHNQKWFFISVFDEFLPTINRTNKNNNDTILNFNYWRITV